jgi:hypothetical protein
MQSAVANTGCRHRQTASRLAALLVDALKQTERTSTMRLPITLIGAALLAVLAISAIAATSAMAAPVERGLCKAAKKGLGEYTDSQCLTPGLKGGAKKEFVWVPVAKAQAFTTTSGEATLKSFTPEGAELPAVTCSKSKGKGKVLTATTTELVVTFEGCISAGEKCTGGVKAKAGQIVTKTLDGVLGTIGGGTGAGEAVGGEGGGVSAEFKCGANEVQVEGAAIGELTPVNVKASTTATEAFNATGSTQEFETLEGVHHNLQTEINGLGAGTFPFRSVLIGRLAINMSSSLILRVFA